MLDKAQYIVPLKKGELQIKYAEALVKIDKAIEYIKRKDICIDIRKTDGSLDYVSTNELLQILEDKEV